ncbi:MAG: hypothetical protein CM15mP100_1380 [Alphaproteobacteria bacterium]|nr:MAG: hypothetical protein CM15mP100_1380 [Alphaproteobacteria bacterium]
MPLLVEAAQAFGSGTHPTTQACLLALAEQRKKKRPPRRILDMGCGSAILSYGGSEAVFQPPIYWR